MKVDLLSLNEVKVKEAALVLKGVHNQVAGYHILFNSLLNLKLHHTILFPFMAQKPNICLLLC
jgi:hypothetical protein